MSRPMPKAHRLALVNQYRGRQRILAEAAHKYISFYEHHDGFAIDWNLDTAASVLREVQSPFPNLESLAEMAVHCVCEEQFLSQVLWQMISNPDAEEAEER